MNKFFVRPSQVLKDTFLLEDEEARHVIKVLRMKIDDEIVASDGIGNTYTGKIIRTDKHSVEVRIDFKLHFSDPADGVILAIGNIKKRDRLEFAIEKAVELGVASIALFHGDHSEYCKINNQRMTSIIISAMKQSLRHHVPELVLFDSFRKMIGAFPGHHIILAHEKSTHSKPSFKKPVLLCVGPEGGFSVAETDFAKEHKADIVSLGNYRLRTETAAIKLLSCYSSGSAL